MLVLGVRMDAQQRQVTATYKIQALGLSKNHVLVRAVVPSDGDVLTMADSWPGDVPELADAGWPALVKNLRVADAHGQLVKVRITGATGWKLARPVHGPISLQYDVDYTPMAARGWPAQREAAFADTDHFVVIGRSVFIRLKGADYASSQWFQEGFTEYLVNLALVSSGLISPEQFASKLASHVTKYHRLTTPLDAPGSHKGPPLYSGGALVAFSWDVMIRDATRGRRGIGDVMRALLANTDGGDRRYSWADIEIALNSVAHEDWADFHRSYISGTEPLPLDETFARVGLRMLPLNDSTARVVPNSSASRAAIALRRAVIGVR